jgi:hypothetical protein
MMNPLTISELTNRGTTEHGIDISADATTSPPRSGSIQVPVAMPAEQMYYWSPEWQTGESEILAEIESGDVVEFKSNDPADVSRWLLGPDDE